MITSIARARTVVGGALVAGVFALTACSTGSSGGSVSTTDVENALKKSSDITQIKSSLTSTQYNAAVECLAKVLQKDANSSDLKDFVDGKKTLDDVQGKNADSAGTEAEACVKNAVGGA